MHRNATRLVTLAVMLAACGPQITLEETRTIDAPGARHPTVAMAEDGALLVAWVVGEPNTADVFLARAEPGGEFGPPVRVNHIPGDAAPHDQAPAQVVAGPRNDVYVVWQNNTVVEGRRFPYSDLRFARSTDGGRTFAPAITVNDDPEATASHTFHDIAVAEDATIRVSWIDGRTGAEYEREHVATMDSAVSAEHAAHMGGHPHAPGPEIRIARSTDGGRSFGASTVIATDACPCCRTSLALGPAGETYLSWRDVAEGDVRDIVVARAQDGATFGPPVRVHDDGWVIAGCPHAGASLAVDAEGRVHVAWFTGAEGGIGLFHAVSEDGGQSFGTPTPLVSGEWVPTSHARLAAGPDGKVWAVWEREDALFLGLVSGDVSAETRIAEGRLPAIAAGAEGAAVVWGSEDGVHVRVAR